MGVIKHQSIRSAVLIYIGFAIGGINTLFLFPHIFSDNEFALTRLLQDIAVILVPVCTISAVPTISRFFPYYSSHLKDKDNDMLTWSVLATLIGFSLFVLATFFCRSWIIREFSENSRLFVSYFFLVYPNVLLFSLFGIFESYSGSRHLTVFPNFLKELVLRLLTTVLVVIYYFKWIDIDAFLWLFSLLYGMLLLALLVYLWRHRFLHFTFKVSNVTRRLSGKIFTYSLSLLGATLLTLLAKNVAPLILSHSKGLNNVAYHTIANYISQLILVPQRSISAIGLPVLAQAWKNKDMDKIEDVYTKSSLLQLIYSLFIFLAVVINIDSIFALLPPSYSAGKYVVIALGVARVVDMGTGLNSQLLSTSRLWRFDLYSSLVFLALSLPLNYYLIEQYGLTGSGYAELISVFVFNLIRFLFIWRKFGLQPFTVNSIKAIGVALVAYFACAWIPLHVHPLVDIAVKGTVFAIIFGGLILALRVSGDINSTVSEAINKYIRKKS
ncbi:polysaccharide biosynthesis C-terminal domain-containing protein [Chitinophaga sp. 212800010-3]|uniref:polysaccharide biosynthesis C-terminal domain-containing protein n=1 Tax=unclassified Chitinophaga TaxID=2619133 RepID=UPI002DEBE730|nr:Membrane protein involved in the export of O-antigen and teichoic acid [Chitinophaga sp. 212800010-3]